MYYELNRRNEDNLLAMNGAKKHMGQYWRSQDILIILRRNPIEDGAISGFSKQKSVPE